MCTKVVKRPHGKKNCCPLSATSYHKLASGVHKLGQVNAKTPAVVASLGFQNLKPRPATTAGGSSRRG